MHEIAIPEALLKGPTQPNHRYRFFNALFDSSILLTPRLFGKLKYRKSLWEVNQKTQNTAPGNKQKESDLEKILNTLQDLMYKEDNLNKKYSPLHQNLWVVGGIGSRPSW
jgi:hypothetical protein